MSMLPIEPDLDRHCFAPCQPGMFCDCRGEWIEEQAEYIEFATFESPYLQKVRIK